MVDRVEKRADLQSDSGTSERRERRWPTLFAPLRHSLSRQLLALTILFVMLAEVMVFVPSISNFRMSWLDEHCAAAQIASLALEATPDHMVEPALREELLRNAQVFVVALHRDSARRLMLSDDMPPNVEVTFDLRHPMVISLIFDAFDTLLNGDGRIIRVISIPRYAGGDFIEIVLDETPLREAMFIYGRNVFFLSLIISIFTAGLVFIMLHLMLVRPMRAITSNMVAFRENPGDDRRVIRPTGRADEIGVAERELAGLQHQVRTTLNQQAHLAALGAAVSKINHDLRNILASAQLISDRLGAVDDPTVQHLAPRLFASIDRAIDLCTATLKFGHADEAAPQRTQVALLELAREVATASGLDEDSEVDFIIDVPDDLRVNADPDQMFRVLLNLTRNAVQALHDGSGGKGRITLRGWRAMDHVHIDLADTGPGLPEKARDNLFTAFTGSTRSGGTGLGLAIASELTRLHGGHIGLLSSSAAGTTFRICIPDDESTLNECDDADAAL